MDGTADLMLRLVVASAAGATLGFEREVRNHAAGIRTHALVALGSALFTIAGAYGFGDLLRAPSIDPARVAAQVASGIGFIGAGAIIRNGLAHRVVSAKASHFLVGAVMLFGYGLSLNLAPIEFHRVVGIYIATLFVMWQLISFIAFRTVPSLPIVAGGSLIVIGGLVVAFWEGRTA